MRCVRCDADNPEGSRFCGGCGAPLADGLVCAGCGRSNPAGHRFCNGCGQSLAPAPADPPASAARPTPSPHDYTPRHLAERILTARAALEGERKQVTVLFADLKGSMEMAERIDTEDSRRAYPANGTSITISVVALLVADVIVVVVVPATGAASPSASACRSRREFTRHGRTVTHLPRRPRAAPRFRRRASGLRRLRDRRTNPLRSWDESGTVSQCGTNGLCTWTVDHRFTCKTGIRAKGTESLLRAGALLRRR